MYFVCFRLLWKKSEKRPAGGDFNRLLLIIVGIYLSGTHTHTRTHKYMPHPPWQRWRRVVSRWPSLPCLDEYRKCQPCTAEAEDTCLSQRSSLSSFSTVCLSLGSLMRSRHYRKAPQEEGGKMLSLMIFNYFLFAFLGFFSFSSILETEEEPCLDPHIAWQGHGVVGGRDFRLRREFPCVRVHSVLWKL